MFIKLHPNNPNVPYAMFKVAESFYKQIPEDWWFMPPSHEKDLSSAMDALHEFRRFIVSFPNHDFIYAAKKLASDCEKILYSHEMFVMEYYLKRDKYRAVVNRLEGAMSNYPNLAETDANLYILIKSYINIKNYQKATTAFQKLIDKFPSSKHIEAAKNLMKQMSNIN
jgi:outer membrane protein assembly factor BamD